METQNNEAAFIFCSSFSSAEARAQFPSLTRVLYIGCIICGVVVATSAHACFGVARRGSRLLQTVVQVEKFILQQWNASCFRSFWKFFAQEHSQRLLDNRQHKAQATLLRHRHATKARNPQSRGGLC